MSAIMRSWYLGPDHPAKLRLIRLVENMARRRVVSTLRPGFKMALDKEDLIQRTLLETGIYESGTTQLLMSELKHHDVFFDVGANVGYFTCLAAKAGVGNIVAVEPDPLNVEILEFNLSLNRFDTASITVAECALSDCVGEQSFYRAHLNNIGMSGFEPNNSVKSLRITTETLDGLTAAKALPPPTVIKIDVEGAEDLVFAGGEALFRRAPPRLVVFEALEVVDGRPVTRAAQVLRDYGYRIEPVPESTDEQSWQNFAARL
jgi:FkbM family methyltransferase